MLTWVLICGAEKTLFYCCDRIALFFNFRHLSSVLGNKFDHGAEAIMPTIFNLIPNSAKIMATSGVVAVRLIIRVSISQSKYKSWHL